jgi:cysteinyl-tRNA synthetase
MNITDVGHLVGDGDEGEDKMDKGAKREGKHPLEIARMYEEQFFKDAASLNILPPQALKRATDTIAEQIEIIQTLTEKGFTYSDDFAIYFDTSKLLDYGKLSGQKLDEKKTGAREEVVVDILKKNPQDFVLWFFTKGKYEHHILRWPSPWGEGFPGWHIECSAISRMLLGQPFDIHCGGVDHIGTHHSNEIAQSEAAFGTPLANYWMHGEFLLINAGRMGKSEGNAYVLKTITDKDYSPLDYRYFLLQGHYRSQINFTWDALDASKTALHRLRHQILELQKRAKKDDLKEDVAPYHEKFRTALSEDLNVPKALAVVWEVLSTDLSPESKLNLIYNFDTVLGLSLESSPLVKIVIPEDIKKRITERDKARANKDFAKSDELRAQIEAAGYEVLDTKDGTKVELK